MRIITTAVLLAALLPGAAFAADCGKLQILDIIHLTPAYGGLEERLPITINGVQKSFIFDTGGFFTQVASPVAQEMKLPVRQGRTQRLHCILGSPVPQEAHDEVGGYVMRRLPFGQRG